MGTTNAMTFFQVLNDLDREINESMRCCDYDSSLIEAKIAIGVAIDLWDNFSKAGGWKPGQTLEDAYVRFIDAIRTNMHTSPSGSPAERVYGDIIEYAQAAMA